MPIRMGESTIVSRSFMRVARRGLIPPVSQVMLQHNNRQSLIVMLKHNLRFAPSRCSSYQMPNAASGSEPAICPAK
jgi:hypothetical protein